jgi:hypothetical protein
MSRKRLQICFLIFVIGLLAIICQDGGPVISSEDAQEADLGGKLDSSRTTTSLRSLDKVQRDRVKTISNGREFAGKFLDSAKNKSIALWTLYRHYGDTIYLNALKDRLLQDPQAGFLLAVESWKQGRPAEERAETLRKAHEAFPTDHMIAICLGSMEAELGNHSRALAAWTSAAASEGSGTGANARRESMREFLVGAGSDEMVAWLEADRFESWVEDAVLPSLSRELQAAFRPPRLTPDRFVENAAMMTSIAHKLDPGRQGVTVIAALADGLEAAALRRLSPDTLIESSGQTAAERIKEISESSAAFQARLDRIRESKLLESPDVRRHFFEVKERQGGMAAVSYVEGLMKK